MSTFRTSEIKGIFFYTVSKAFLFFLLIFFLHFFGGKENESMAAPGAFNLPLPVDTEKRAKC